LIIHDLIRRIVYALPVPQQSDQKETITYRKDIIFQGASVGRINGGLEILFFADPENDEYQCEVKLGDAGIDGLIKALSFFGYHQ